MDNYKAYLESSQRVRASIESEQNLSQIIDRALKSRGFGGNNHSVFLAGNFGGNHTAIRTFSFGADLDYMQADLEYCARKYAETIGSRYRVPKFAIGSIIGMVPYLFTEDLTEDGRYQIILTNDHGGILEPVGQEILFDFGLEDLSLGQSHRIQQELFMHPLFFAQEHLLAIR
ncbi:MAG: hypothetical protein AABX32_06000 [Nanoarchaeota archaeon]